MGLYGNSGHQRTQYKHIGEVPANQLTEWLASHCLACGTHLVTLRRSWQELNNEWAEEASLELLEQWMERLGAHSIDEVRQQIREGLLSDVPPYYTIRPGVSTVLAGHDDQHAHHMCSDCFTRIFDVAFGEPIFAEQNNKVAALLTAIVDTFDITVQKPH